MLYGPIDANSKEEKLSNQLASLDISEILSFPGGSRIELGYENGSALKSPLNKMGWSMQREWSRSAKISKRLVPLRRKPINRRGLGNFMESTLREPTSTPV